jgi:cytochrome c oxidase subunit 3
MNAAPEQKHPYHLVEPSPWPIVGTIAALLTFGGAVMALHEVTGGLVVMILGLLLILYTMFVWWRDVVREATFEGHHNPIVQLTMRYGMALFIASEVMFFVAWFWAYFNAALYPPAQIGGVWPPEGITVFDPWGVPFLNTLILLSSGCTVTWAHHELRQGNQQGLIQGLVLTIVLGVSFTGFQAFEYASAPFAFTDGVYPTTFFMATGFHGAHVIIGTCFLTVCLFRAWRGHFKPDHHFGFEAAAWYWHFVDVVWLFLFTCIYWWGAGDAPVH